LFGGLGLGRRRGTGVSGARRQGDLGGAEERRDGRRGGGARQPIGAAMADARLGEAVEAAQEVLPFRRKAGLMQEIVEMLLHRERQERAEDAAADGGVGGMQDRPGAHDRLGAAEEVLDLKEIAAAQDRLQRGDLGAGAQHEDPVEARLLGELAGVDLE
jgi:hypothetical protein